MEDTGENSAARLTMKALLESDKKKQIILIGHSMPSLLGLLNGAESTTTVVSFDYDDFDIERARREMKSIGLSLDNSIDELRPPISPFPIEEFNRVGETINPFKTKKKSPEWKNKLKSLYRVKI